MSALAIVLARAGSKGLPGKNIRPIAGKPCAAWTIEAAHTSKRTTHVVVSTDCSELHTIAQSLAVDVIRRPPELASDTATVDDAARHALRASEALHKQSFDVIALLYANVPVRPKNLIDDALALQKQTGCDSVQSYARVGKHHPWWTCRVDETNGAVKPWEGDQLNHGVHRRQDLPPAFVPDGGVLVVLRTALMLEIPGVAPGPHAFLGNDRRGIITGEGEVIDIDTEIDALVAEAILQQPKPVGSLR